MAMRGSSRSEAGKTTGLWALRVLEEQLGSDWLERAWRRDKVPDQILMASFHQVGYLELLELALRVTLLGDVRGIADVRRELRSDVRPDRLFHTQLQLEVGALGYMRGHAIEFERAHGSGYRPDVVLQKMEHSVLAECFVVELTESHKNAAAAFDRASSTLMAIAHEHDVDISGEVLASNPDELVTGEFEDLDLLLRLCGPANGTMVVDRPWAMLRIERADQGSVRSLVGQASSTDPWWHLRGKLLRKAQRTPDTQSLWLRADVRNGIWQFGDWALAPLEAKCQFLSGWTHRVLANASHLAGVVFSCGLCHNLGGRCDKQVEMADGTIGLTRLVPPVRARELIVVPLHDDALHDRDSWRELYLSERDWLDYALAGVGLPPLVEVIGPA